MKTWFQKALEAPETAYDRALKVDAEVENAARWCARNGYDGSVGQPLPDLMSGWAHDAINSDVDAFKRRVARYR